MKAGLVALMAAASGAAVAQPVETSSGPSDAFELGQIIVTARPASGPSATGGALSSEAIYSFNRNSLDEAANLIPGVAASNSGGSRNERLLFVRGFDRLQVPLSIDGTRVYLPADNRLDFGRFLTPDVAEIQVAKGYVSVLNGPGAMGGAVNLVTRKPTKAIEAEMRGTLTLDRGVSYQGYNVFALFGTRQDRWYAQASYTRNVRDHFTLAGDFVPTANEDGGERERSDTRDWRVNAKLGFTPNDTDEYSISYTRQEGAKNAPIETTVPLPAQRFWSWPYWNLESVYFLSTTALGDAATLKARAYRNSFNNLLRAFDDRSQTRQSLPRAFDSYYDDEAYGGSAQLDVALTPADTLRLAAHYRRDRHAEFQQVFPVGSTEPRQTTTEDTYSIALENQLALSSMVDLTLGASYDWRDLNRAEDFSGTPGTPAARFIRYPLRNAAAVNGQGRLAWRPDDRSELQASLSSRVRFPTIFERFSSRFGGATSAPDLQEERATHVEVGGSRDLGGVRVEGAVYYAWLRDVIVAFPIVFNGQPVTQSRNLGKGDYHGGEIAVAATLTPQLQLGGNYSHVRRELDDPGNAAFRPTGVPTHKAFAYANWTPLPRLRIVPNVEVASNRWIVNTAGTRYFRGGNYALVNLRLDYEVIDGVDLGVGARNLLDDDYELAQGFPEEGRSFFASLRARY